jgi:predicted nucleic acid-binding protein
MVSEDSPRVFLDTNVLFSGLRTPGGKPHRILEAATAGGIRAVVSGGVLVELFRNMRRKAPAQLPNLERFLTETPLEVIPEPAAEHTEPWSQAGLGSDAPIVAAAVLAEVDYFCTGDQRLLAKASLMERTGLAVVTPAELLEKLG